jgi:hypothetical protein
VGYAVQYDPIDTIRWMLNEARDAVLADTYVDDKGKAKAKTKARREAERIRYQTLCEVVWNVTGRTEPLETVTERELVLA